MSAELMRLLSNIIRTGIISEVDEKSWRVRVRSGELETGWLRWNTTRAGAFNVWLPPSPGEQVVIACIGGNPETAMIIGSLWSDASPAPGQKPERNRGQRAGWRGVPLRRRRWRTERQRHENSHPAGIRQRDTGYARRGMHKPSENSDA